MRKAPRRDQVIKIKEAHPDKPGIEIARELGISRQRVNLILLKGGYPRRPRRPVKYCARCRKELSHTTKGYFCRQCYNEDLRRRSTVNLRCAYCGKSFTRTKRYVNGAHKEGQKNFFCGHSCRAKSTWAKRKGTK